MNDIKGIIEDVEKSNLVSNKVIKKVIKIIGQKEWNNIHNEESDICTTKGELIITLKGIAELEKENAELKGIKDIATLIRANNDTVITLMQLNNMLVNKNQQLTKAKELLAKWVKLFRPKGGNIPPTPIQVETEQFINEVKK